MASARDSDTAAAVVKATRTFTIQLTMCVRASRTYISSLHYPTPISLGAVFHLVKASSCLLRGGGCGMANREREREQFSCVTLCYSVCVCVCVFVLTRSHSLHCLFSRHNSLVGWLSHSVCEPGKDWVHTHTHPSLSCVGTSQKSRKGNSLWRSVGGSTGVYTPVDLPTAGVVLARHAGGG